MRPRRHRSSDVAVADNAQVLAANLDNIKLIPSTGHLAQDQAPEILGKEQHGADSELSEHVTEYPSRIGQRNRTCDQLWKQRAVKPGRSRMDPPHARSHPPDFFEKLGIAQPVQNHFGTASCAIEGFGSDSHGDFDCIRQFCQHGQLWLGWVGQNQNCDIVHEEKTVACSTFRWKSCAWWK